MMVRVGASSPSRNSTAGVIDSGFISTLEAQASGGAPTAVTRAALAHLAAGEFELSQHEPDKALEHFAAMEPFAGRQRDLVLASLDGRIYAQLMKSEYSSALELIDRARKLSPQSANLAALSGWAHYRMADYAGAAKAQSVPDFILHIIPNTIVDAFTRGDILQVLLVAILFGFALSAMGPRCKHVVDLFDGMTHAVFGVVNIVMRLAPIGAFGAMAFTIGKYGIAALGPLLKLILTFYLTCIVFVVVILGAVCWAVGFNIFKYLAYIKEEILLTLATSSSEPALPTLMSKMEKLGCSKSLVGLVVPTGYTFNTDGSSMYMTLAALFIAQATNTHLTLGQQLTIFIVAVLTSKGASGVQGAAFIALVGTLTVIPTIPVAGMALLLGIDRFMSMARAMVNMLGNGVATLVVARWEKEIDGKTLTKNMAKPQPVASVPEPVNAEQTVL